jgi:hypothetical protein
MTLNSTTYIKILRPNGNKIRIPLKEKLVKFPDNIPSDCIKLDLSWNKIETIPDDLPDSIVSLDLTCNPIKSWPNKFPKSLEILIVDFNSIGIIPYNLPENIKKVTEGLCSEYWWDIMIFNGKNKFLSSSLHYSCRTPIMCLGISLPSIKIFNKMKTTYFHFKVYYQLFYKCQLKTLNMIFQEMTNLDIPINVHEILLIFLRNR